MPAPGNVPACQMPNTAPSGSTAIPMFPTSPTLIGSTISDPPAALIRSAVAAASATPKYTVHDGGMASWPGCLGAIAAAARPSANAIV